MNLLQFPSKENIYKGKLIEASGNLARIYIDGTQDTEEGKVVIEKYSTAIGEWLDNYDKGN